MRRLAVLASLVLVAGALAACGKDDPPATGGTAVGAGAVAGDVAQAKQAASTSNGRCPVLPDQLVEADAPVVEYDDPVTKRKVRVGFCCDKCPVKFKAEPEKFMARMRAEPAKFGYAP
jgi:hypothetical protein